MVVTCSQQRQQDNLEEEEECLQQERDGSIMSSLYKVDGGSQAEGTGTEMTHPIKERDGDESDKSDDIAKMLDGEESHEAARSWTESSSWKN